MDGEKNSLKDNLASKSEKKSIRPGFLGGSGGGEAPIGLNTENPGLGREDASTLAEKNLNEAEKSAAGGLYNRGDNLDGAREAEKGGFYSGGGGKTAEKVANIATRGKFKGVFKKGGPAVGIIFVIFGVGALMGGTQFFQPFSLVAQFQETFNSMEKSANARSTRWARWQLGDYVKNPVKGSKIFGTEHFKLSDKQVEELKTQGIEVNEDRTEMRYTTATGEEKTVTAGDFRSTYDTDTDFFHKYNAGSMTWRGQFANWFGTNTSIFLRNNKITRNLFHDFKEGGDTEAGLDKVKKKLKDRTKTINDGGIRVVQREENEPTPVMVEDENGNMVEATDENGNVIYEQLTDAEGKPMVDAEGNPIYAIDDLATDNESSGSITRGDTAAIDAKLADISGKFNTAANAACGVLGAIGTVTLLIAADEALQIINITSAYFEAVNKTQAGHGDEAPINELTNTLNEKMHSEGETIDGTYESDKTAMQAAGIGALYGGGVVNPNDPSVQSFNAFSSMKRVANGVGLSMEEFEGCLAAKGLTAIASAAIDAVTIGACIVGLAAAVFTLGISATACSGLAANIVGQVLLGALAGLVVEEAISMITPIAKAALTRDLTENLGGEDLGNALTSGANMYQGGTHRANGGSLATADKYEEFAIVQQQIIAEKAKEERLALSPFDITSKNTFMGAIMTQLMDFNTTSSLMSVITAGGSVMSSSLVGLTASTATAYNLMEGIDYYESDYDDICPYLASINAVGDAYCNPYIMTDVDTMDLDPGTVIDKVDKLGGFEDGESSDGNVVIKKESDLAKYIRFCDNRTSPFGVADQGIVGEVASNGQVSTGSGLDSLINGAIGSIPVVGDALEIMDDADALNNIGYISGESCVAGNEVGHSDDAEAAQNSEAKAREMKANGTWNIPETGDEDDKCEGTLESPCWNKAKYYQRFIEDQSLAESTGLIQQSAVSAYLEDYYKENPLDNSYEGQLARYSGLDKKTVEETLDVIAYYDYINNYDASERYAFEGVVEEIEDERMILLDEENILDGDVVMPENIVYADVRNRTFVV